MDIAALISAARGLGGRLALRRRLVVAGLAGVTVLCALNVLRPASAPTRAVWVAARNLGGGKPIASHDLRVERLPSADVPSGVLFANAVVVGRLLAAPMRSGEPLTDVRLVSASLLSATGPPGDVAVPVRIADGPAALALVHAGDLVDVIATPDTDEGGPPVSTDVVHDVRVLATPTDDPVSADNGDSDDSAGLLVVAVSPGQAAALASADDARLSIAVRRGP